MGAHDAALKDAPSAQSVEPVASVPEGYAMVPVVPTEDMKIAAAEAYDTWGWAGRRQMWDAMLAAAPTPAAPRKQYQD